jgi:hypothetical protein
MRLAAFGLLLLSLTAYAGTQPEPPNFGDPAITPAHATTTDDVRWSAPWDGCGALGPTTVTRNGGRIEVRWPVQRFCGVPIGPVSAGFDLGHLPIGTYTVHVDPCDVGFGSFEDLCSPIESPDDVFFAVTGLAEASPLPTLSFWALIAASLLLGSVGAICFRFSPSDVRS